MWYLYTIRLYKGDGIWTHITGVKVPCTDQLYDTLLLLVGRMGFEPMTTCVSDRYSKPTELPSYIWKEKDSNLHRAGLQPAALPLELSFQKENHLSLSDKWFSNVQSIVTYLHIAQFKRSTISDKDITKSPVFVIKTNLNIPLYLLKLSHHSCRSHCFCSPLLNIFYSLSSGNRIWTGNLRVMGPVIFHLIISRDWKRQIRTTPHAPRASVLPLHHVLKASERSACFLPLYIIIKKPSVSYLDTDGSKTN